MKKYIRDALKAHASDFVSDLSTLSTSDQARCQAIGRLLIDGLPAEYAVRMMDDLLEARPYLRLLDRLITNNPSVFTKT